LLTSDECYTRNPDFIYRKVIEETILVPLNMNVEDMDCIYTLNEIGAFIWEQLEIPLSHDQLLQTMLDEFEVAQEVLDADLEVFLGELLEIGALKRADR